MSAASLLRGAAIAGSLAVAFALGALFRPATPQLPSSNAPAAVSEPSGSASTPATPPAPHPPPPEVKPDADADAVSEDRVVALKSASLIPPIQIVTEEDLRKETIVEDDRPPQAEANGDAEKGEDREAERAAAQRKLSTFNAIEFSTAIERVANGVLGIGRVSSLGYAHGLSLFGAFIKDKTGAKVEVHLEKGVSYFICGGGDNFAVNVDLQIKDAAGRVLARDLKPDAAPLVNFVPRSTGSYWIEMIVAEANANGSFCAMAIMKPGGWSVHPDNMLAACAKVMVSYAAISDLDGGYKFLDAPSQWSFFGGVLEKGQSHRFTNVRMGDGQRIILSAGDNNALDIDLRLWDRPKSWFAKDEKADALPIVKLMAQDRQRFGIEVKNETARSASMVVALILSK